MNSHRITAIDNYRALTMLLMIFVIDVGNVSNIPAWIGHAALDEDRMGFADIIFPCFMFIIGLSIPHAINARLSKGQSRSSILVHIVSRTVSLLAMGLLVVNMDNMQAQSMLISRSLWMLLMVVGIFLVWNEYPSSKVFKVIPKQALQGIGLIILGALMYCYKGPNNSWLQIHWWGILGLLAWSYFLSALIYISMGRRLLPIITSLIILLLLNINEFIGGYGFKLIISASNHFSVFLGVVCSVYLLHKNKNSYLAIPVLGGVAVALVIFGLVTRPIWEISKIRATPSWTAICGGISIFTYIAIIYLSKLKLSKFLFTPIAAGGYATLSCYFLQYLVYALMGLTLISWPNELSTGIMGIARSLLFAYGVILLAALANKMLIKLKI